MSDTPECIRDSLLELYDDLLFADGFDAAIVGVAQRCGMEPVVCYDIETCINILMETEGMSHEEASEYFAFNTLGAYVGPQTPMWLTKAPPSVAADTTQLV